MKYAPNKHIYWIYAVPADMLVTREPSETELKFVPKNTVGYIILYKYIINQSF